MNDHLTPLEWNIGLSAWIIQDGNYPDFVAGQSAEFAVEFYVKPSTEFSNSKDDIGARYVDDSNYNVVAAPVLQTPDLTVLDIGILTYRQRETSFQRHEPGARIETSLNLGIDPFFYFERLAKNPQVPPLIYSWRILSILRQTAPWLETRHEDGRTWRIRDESKLGYVEINKTDAWADDGGSAEYVLSCELLPVEPKEGSQPQTNAAVPMYCSLLLPTLFR